MGRLPSHTRADRPISYGDYFKAVRTFLANDRFSAVRDSFEGLDQKDLNPADIEKIDIFLAKHGEFYHPARVETVIGGRRAALALNVALTQVGRQSIHREFHCLKRLETEFQSPYLPRVYRLGNGVTASGHTVRMFSGEWFEDHCEFHLSKDPSGGGNKILVWDVNHGNFYLSPRETRDLYRQAAFILSTYYNAETFEQIYPFHHAAGDFVLKRRDRKIDLKLITVRNYAPLHRDKKALQADGKERAGICLNSLLVFFLNMMMRMRLDRMDGVGEMVWAGETAVRGAVEGFFQGLENKPSIRDLPGPTEDILHLYLLELSLSEMADFCAAIVQKGYHPRAPETAVIKGNLASHAACLHDALRKL